MRNVKTTMELMEVTRKGDWITKGVAQFKDGILGDRLFIATERWEKIGRPVTIHLTIEGKDE